MARVVSSSPLFRDHSLLMWNANRRGIIAKEIDKIPDSQFSSQSAEQLQERLAKDLRVEGLSIRPKEKKMSAVESQVSPEPDAFYMGDPPSTVLGQLITIRIPYSGDFNLWKCQPSSYTSTFPHGDIFKTDDNSGFLEFKIEQPKGSPNEEVLRVFDRNMEDVEKYIKLQAGDIAKWNEGLDAEIANAIAVRKERFSKRSELFGLFGAAPIEDTVMAHAPAPTAATSSRKPASAKSRDVFISHAYEDKEAFVRPLALELQRRGLSVWYDEFELKLGDSIPRSIDEGLRISRFGVVVLSPSFFAKEWPRKELESLLTKESKGNKVVLPVWHNIDHDGVSNKSPILATKLAVKSSEGFKKVADQIEAILRAK